MSTKPAIYLLSVLALSLLIMTACQSPEVTSAKVYFQQENIDAAEEQLLIALEKEPQNPEVPYLLASGVYAPRKDYDKALDMLAKAVKLDPSYKDKADQFHKKFWADTHTEGANYFNNALRAVFPAEKDSLLKLAAAKFEDALAIKDDEDVTYNGLVKCHFMREDTAAVIAVANMMREKDLFEKDVFYYYGQVIWEPGKEEQALAELTANAPRMGFAAEESKLLTVFSSLVQAVPIYRLSLRLGDDAMPYLKRVCKEEGGGNRPDGQ